MEHAKKLKLSRYECSRTWSNIDEDYTYDGWIMPTMDTSWSSPETVMHRAGQTTIQSFSRAEHTDYKLYDFEHDVDPESHLFNLINATCD